MFVYRLSEPIGSFDGLTPSTTGSPASTRAAPPGHCKPYSPSPPPCTGEATSGLLDPGQGVVGSNPAVPTS